jgi:hypothetical protein
LVPITLITGFRVLYSSRLARDRDAGGAPVLASTIVSKSIVKSVPVSTIEKGTQVSVTSGSLRM